MTTHLSTNDIRNLGFDWPKHSLIESYCVVEGGSIDLGTTAENLRSSRAFYQSKINQAYNFKTQTGADYSDFTNRFDEYVRMKNDLNKAIRYLEEIIEAAR